MFDADATPRDDKTERFEAAGDIVLKPDLLLHQLLAHGQQRPIFLAAPGTNSNRADEVSAPADKLSQTTGIILIRLVAAGFEKAVSLERFKAYHRQPQLGQLEIQPTAHGPGFQPGFYNRRELNIFGHKPAVDIAGRVRDFPSATILPFPFTTQIVVSRCDTSIPM